MILDLETNVQALRDENRDLKAKVEAYHGRLKSAADKLSQMPASAVVPDGSDTSATLLVEALNALQRCMEQCPRTFNRNPHSPVIALNVPSKRQVRPL